MTKISNYEELIKSTDDIEFLRAELLQSRALNLKLHRRAQENESVITQLKQDNDICNKFLDDCRNNNIILRLQLHNINYKVRKLPFIIKWFTEKYLK